VAPSRDQDHVLRHDDEQLRRFLVARRAGEEAAAQRWWEALLAGNFDRVRGMVVLESRGRLSNDEQDEALQLALVKIAVNMIHTFRGSTMGEWVLATRRLVTFACIDTQRRAAVRSRHERAIADDDREVYDAIEERRREQEALDAEADALDDARAWLDWAVPQLSPARRAVIELDRENVDVEEIQRRLGVSRDVVYASRSRALKDLVKLREQHTP
jgi:Sigma-70, region 4